MTPNSALEFLPYLKDLLSQERQTTVAFLIALAEVYRKELYKELGYDDLWAFVERGLGQSKTMTHYRCASAKAVAKFPQVIEPLRDGRLCMTSLAKLAPELTPENCEDVLARAMGQPTRGIQRLKAELHPKPVPKDVVRDLPVSTVSIQSTDAPKC